jgi:preprotein translocase subunit SecE
MSLQKENSNITDRLKWFAVLFIAIVLVVGNAYFSQFSLTYRVAAMIVLAVIAILIALTTASGAKAWDFIKATRTEMRKVVWPTRQETVQTTMMIIAIVAVMALILWAIDSLFALVITSIIM